MWRVGSVLMLAAALGAIAGCAVAAPAPIAKEPAAAAPTAPASTREETYVCGGEPIARGAYEAARTADTLDEDAHALVAAGTDDAGEPVVPDDLASWTIVAASPSRVVLIRELDEPHDDVGMGELHDHELYVASTDFAPEWPVYGRQFTCALEHDVAPRIRGLLQIDADNAPKPGDTEIPLLITEWACNGGEDAAGRVHVISVVETDDTVVIRAALEPKDSGAYTCQGHPPTPFSVTLDEPLGDRAILDGSLVMPREPSVWGPAVILD